MIHTKEQLQEYRLSKEWSYREMERQTGLDRKKLSKWEKNGIPADKKIYLNYVLFGGRMLGKKKKRSLLKGCVRFLLLFISPLAHPDRDK